MSGVAYMQLLFSFSVLGEKQCDKEVKARDKNSLFAQSFYFRFNLLNHFGVVNFFIFALGY